jgi:hypothetical protein
VGQVALVVGRTVDEALVVGASAGHEQRCEKQARRGLHHTDQFSFRSGDVKLTPYGLLDVLN